MQVKAQLAQNLIDTRQVENQIWPGNMVAMPNFPTYANPTCMSLSSICPQSSLESIGRGNVDGMGVQERERREEFCFQTCTKKRPSQTDFGELQALALRMMRN